MHTARGLNGRVSFDGHVVAIERRGLWARMTLGKGTKSFPVTAITGVQLKPAGIVPGFIQFTVPGGNEQTSSFGHQSSDAAKDENSVLFGGRRQADFVAVRDAVQAAVAQVQRRAQAPAPRRAATSVADELAKLAHLLDVGVLTQAEFDGQKAKLLRDD
jgi:membrane protease subunit (stomatin/prohibitin family)